MPELPEVETIVRGLNPLLKGKKVRDFFFLSSHLWFRQPSSLKPDDYRAKVIRSIRRRGKMVIFEFEEGLGLLVHLKMTGQLYLAEKHLPVDKHTHARMTFSDFNRELRFRDVRKFGFLSCLQLEEIEKKLNSELGPEPLQIDFPVFRRLLRRHGQKRIKGWLLDQKILAGIGNIYSDEILFRAGFHPERKAASLSELEARRLFKVMKKVLKRAIELKGSSVSDYVDFQGEKGGYQQEHQVYDREGELCRRCRKATIRRQRICGRSSFYCPKCQV
jgi:formamidopyrimidine-DNA glycosylase